MDPMTARPDSALGEFQYFTWSMNAQYYVYRKLGRGTFGSVALARRFPENSVVALKEPVVPYKHPRNASVKASLRNEAMIMQDLRHKNIVKILDFFESTDSDEWGILHQQPINVYEYCELGDLSKFVSQGAIHMVWVSTLFKQMLSALDYLESKKVVHNDVRPGNILVSAGPDGTFVPKLADFGLAKMTRKEGIMSWYVPEKELGILDPDWAWQRMPDGQWVCYHTAAIDVFQLGLIVMWCSDFCVGDLSYREAFEYRSPEELPWVRRYSHAVLLPRCPQLAPFYHLVCSPPEVTGSTGRASKILRTIKNGMKMPDLEGFISSNRQVWERRQSCLEAKAKEKAKQRGSGEIRG